MIKETLGRDQSYARVVNNELVIKHLRKNNMSATELANALYLSHAALSSILKGLLQEGIIKVATSISRAGKGRKQVCYTLNEEYGIIIVVSLSDNRYKISISNIKEETLVEQEKEIDRYDVAIIYEIVLCIKNLISDAKYRDIPVKHIIIALPGRVNSHTKELQLSKQFDKDLFGENNKIVSIFENHFNVPITLQNDINLSLIGEIKSGCLVNVQNAMVAYIDNGVGAAFVFNGKSYEGELGYAGELGLMQTTFKGKESYLDEFISLRSIKDYAKEKNNKKYHVSQLVEEYYLKGDLYEYINETARVLGKKLRDIVELLNISHIVLSGRIAKFGDDYLNCVREEVSKSQNSCQVMFSTLGKSSILIGAMSNSVDQSISRELAKNDSM